MRKGIRKRRKTLPGWELLKATLCGTVAAIAGLLLLALLLYLDWLPDSAIGVGNMCLKVLGAALAGLWIGRTVQEHPFVYGGAAALLFTALTTLLFSLLLGSFEPRWTLLSDALLAFAIGSATALLLQWLHGRKAREKS